MFIKWPSNCSSNVSTSSCVSRIKKIEVSTNLQYFFEIPSLKVHGVESVVELDHLAPWVKSHCGIPLPLPETHITLFFK